MLFKFCLMLLVGSMAACYVSHNGGSPRPEAESLGNSPNKAGAGLSSVNWIGACGSGKNVDLKLRVINENWTLQTASGLWSDNGESLKAQGSAVEFEKFQGSLSADMVCTKTSGTRTIGDRSSNNYLQCSLSTTSVGFLTDCPSADFIPDATQDAPLASKWFVGSWKGTCADDATVKLNFTEESLTAQLTSLTGKIVFILYPDNRISTLGPQDGTARVLGSDTSVSVSEGLGGAENGAASASKFSCKKGSANDMSCDMGVYVGGAVSEAGGVASTCTNLQLKKVP